MVVVAEPISAAAAVAEIGIIHKSFDMAAIGELLLPGLRRLEE